MLAHNQAQTLAERPLQDRDATKPQVLLDSELELTVEQEERLFHHIRQELQSLRTQTGRDEYNADDSTHAHAALQRNGSSFFGRRHLAHLVYTQNMEWRASIMGGIYKHTNVHLPITTRILSQQIARANRSFFGTQPYFAVSATNSAQDKELADQIEAWSRHQLERQANLSAHLSQAIELAFIQGESVVKTTRHKLTSFFEAYRSIAIDPQTGEPFIAADGDYIYETDTFTEQMQEVTDETGQPVLDETGLPIQQPTGLMILSRDQETPRPDNMSFDSRKLQLAQTLHDHTRTYPVHYLDFLCSIHSPDIQTAPTIAHLYDAPIIEMCHRLLQETFDGQPPKEKLDKVARLAHSLMAGSSTDYHQGAAATRPRSELGEIDAGETRTEPTREMAEVWVWYDVFGDGVQRSLMILTDAEGNIPIYYNYAANVTHDGQRPFDVIRINPVPNRWHGLGNVEKFWDLQSTADLILNRAFLSQSRAGRIDFVQPSAIASGDPTQINWGSTVELASGKTAQDAWQSIYLQDSKSETLMSFFQTILQAAQTMGGVANVNDGNMAGLDTTKLATGVKNLERSGEELFALWLFHLTPGITSATQRALDVCLHQAQNSPEDLIRFFDQQTNQLIQLNQTTLKDLHLDARLELTTYRSQAQLTQAQMAYNMAVQWLQVQDPAIRKRLEPLVRQFLKSLEILEIDQIVEEFSPEEQQMQSMMQPPQGGGTIPVTEPPPQA